MRASDWHDPHGIIPEQFKTRYSYCETVDEALAHAEQRPSTTPVSEDGVCPECGSRRLHPKASTMQEMPHKVESAYKCETCGAHVDEKEYPESMNHNYPPNRFDWLSSDELEESDDRGMGPLFEGVDDDTLAELVLRVYKPWTDDGPSYRELAKLVPYTRYWVGKRVREWKGGEHRDLVPEPEPTPTVDETASSDATAVATDGGRRSRWAAFGS